MLSSLPVPSSWVDPVTQIWPSHISGPYLQARDAAVEKKAGQAESDTERGTGESLEQAMGAGLRPPTPTAQAELEEEAAQRLVRRFPEFFELYGYLWRQVPTEEITAEYAHWGTRQDLHLQEKGGYYKKKQKKGKLFIFLQRKQTGQVLQFVFGTRWKRASLWRHSPDLTFYKEKNKKTGLSGGPSASKM
jgi:hypothetical protein